MEEKKQAKKRTNLSFQVGPHVVEALRDDVEYLWAPPTEDLVVYEEPPSPLVFLRDHVSRSRPCLIRNALGTPGAKENPPNRNFNKLTLAQLQAQWPASLPLYVDVTPDGHGDCLRQVAWPPNNHDTAAAAVTNPASSSTTTSSSSAAATSSQQFFVKPMTCRMSMDEFCRALQTTTTHNHNHGQTEHNHQATSPTATPTRNDKGVTGCTMSNNNNTMICQDKHSTTTDRIHDRVFAATIPTSHSKDKNDDNLVDDEGEKILAPPPPPPAGSGVFYYSRQNDCLRTELQSLLFQSTQNDDDDDDEDGMEHTRSSPPSVLFPLSLDWAAQAFGKDDDDDDDDDDRCQPDAMNLWIGNDRAVSALHKDPYENLYHVLEGTKIFTLIPPACAPWLPVRENIPSGQFVWDGTSWKVCVDVAAVGEGEEGEHNSSGDDGDDEDSSFLPKLQTVRWIALEDLAKESSLSAQTTSSSSVSTTLWNIPAVRQVTVQAGEMLYLPALWFHQVAQRGHVTIAVNYWYDMKFTSPLWTYFHFMEGLSIQRGCDDDDDDDE